MSTTYTFTVNGNVHLVVEAASRNEAMVKANAAGLPANFYAWMDHGTNGNAFTAMFGVWD